MKNLIIALGLMATACGKPSGASDTPGPNGNSNNGDFDSKVACIKEHGRKVSKTTAPREIARAFTSVSKSCDINLDHINRYFGE